MNSSSVIIELIAQADIEGAGRLHQAVGFAFVKRKTAPREPASWRPVCILSSRNAFRELTQASKEFLT
jgi:hypothetical protein